MSTISNRHSVVPFVAGTSAALTGQRLTRVLYKPSAKAPAKYPSACASVPHISTDNVQDNINRLMPVIVDYLHDVQDKVIKSLYESSDGTLQSIGDDDISISAIIGYLSAERSGGRVTIAMIEQWFDSCLKDNLYAGIAERKGLEEVIEGSAIDNQITGTVNGHRAMYCAYMTGKTVYSTAQLNSLKTALRYTIEESVIEQKIAEKLEESLRTINTVELL